MGNDGKKAYQIAFTGAYVGQNIVAGNVDSVAPGTTTVLANIPDGSYVYNIESSPGDGGEFCRSAGTFALVVSHGQHVTLEQGEASVYGKGCCHERCESSAWRRKPPACR